MYPERDETKEVKKQISHDERVNWKLYVDAVYKADSNKKIYRKV